MQLSVKSVYMLSKFPSLLGENIFIHGKILFLKFRGKMSEVAYCSYEWFSCCNSVENLRENVKEILINLIIDKLFCEQFSVLPIKYSLILLETVQHILTASCAWSRGKFIVKHGIRFLPKFVNNFQCLSKEGPKATNWYYNLLVKYLLPHHQSKIVI